MRTTTADFLTLLQEAAQAYLSAQPGSQQPDTAYLKAQITRPRQRGAADLWAFYKLHHNTPIFEAQLPHEPGHRALFHWAERLRLYALCPAYLRGARHNMKRLLTHQIATDPPPPKASDARMVKIHAALTATLLHNKPRDPAFRHELRALCRNQRAFGQHLLDLLAAKKHPGMPPASPPSMGAASENPAAESSPPPKERYIEPQASSGKPLCSAPKSMPQSHGGPHMLGAQGSTSWAPSLQGQPYRVYTRAFDEIRPIHAYVPAPQLRHLEQQLQEKAAPLLPRLAPLAQKLRRHLQRSLDHAHPQRATEGDRLNAHALARVMADPAYPVWQKSVLAPIRPAAVTLLLDNSGSMRGRPILMTALCAQLLNWALAPFGVDLEIIGFTTAHWQGGRSLEAWQRQGRPAFPGRLNDVRYIIYKSFGQSAAMANHTIPGMLEPGLLRENIDGEALLFAHSRLQRQQAEKKLLMVISDGAPVDDATLAHNGPSLLEDHLRRAIALVGRSQGVSKLSLLALGIGHDVAQYYPHAHTLHTLDHLGTHLFTAMLQFFSQGRAG